MMSGLNNCYDLVLLDNKSLIKIFLSIYDNMITNIYKNLLSSKKFNNLRILL